MITEQAILDKLRQIIDPDLHQDIVSLGFIQNLKIDGGKIAFSIALTTPACPVKGEFETRAEELVKSITGVKEVKVHMTSMPPKTATAVGQIESTLSQVKSIIAVSSCKGGVGKSTVAAYLALELAHRGYKVGLVDADVHGPSVPTLFNLQNAPVYANEKKQIIPLWKHNIKIMSFGFLLGDAPAVMRGPVVTRYVQQLIHNTEWGELDYLFIDMPPGTGDVQLTITQSVRLNGAVIVTTRQTLSLVDVARGILMFEKVDVPILGIVENMSYFICDNCNKKHYIFGGSASQSLEERFGLNMLAEIPLMPELTTKIEGPVNNSFINTAVDNTIRALGTSMILKKQVPAASFDEHNTTLRWPDGEEAIVSNRDLRLSCRCALCVNEITGEKVLKPQDVRPDIMPQKVIPLGNYAIGIEWNDGHTSGIYPYKTIRELAHKTAAK